MSVKRSNQMFLAAFWLSKAGRKSGGGRVLPPAELGTDQWKRAYAAFYASLGDGRTFTAFKNSLKNARDMFDAWTDSGRRGWRRQSARREPLPLTSMAQQVFEHWSGRSNVELWEAVRPYAEVETASIPATVISDLESELEPSGDFTAGTEGGRRVVVSTRIERDPKLRAAALEIHGFACMACGFSFEKVYGSWGKGFAEVHHLQPLGERKRETDPKTDLAVLCANCHRMVHRKRGMALTLDELRGRIGSKSRI